MRTRRLVLRQETLAPLSGDDLAVVGGAAIPTTPFEHCLSPRYCVDIEVERTRVLPCNTSPCTS